MTVCLNWRRAKIGPPRPCRYCGRPAILRDPGNGRATHKVCAELAIVEGRRRTHRDRPAQIDWEVAF